MIEILASVLVLGLGVVVAALLTSRDRSSHRSLVWISLAAHFGGALAQIAIQRYVYGYGDMLSYHFRGGFLADLIRYDAGRWLGPVVQLVFLGKPDFPMYVIGAGSPTGSMLGISALLSVVFGGSLFAMNFFSAILSFAGKYLVVIALRDRIREAYHRHLYIAFLLVPSAVFWSSGLFKENYAVAALGVLIYGSFRFIRTRSSRSFSTIGVGVVGVAITKPYILVAFTFAVAVWLYWRAARRTGQLINPRGAVAGLVVGMLGIVVIGRLFPQYAIDQVLDEALVQQEAGLRNVGGSNFQLTGQGEGASFARQIVLVPLALMTALFRPFFFEVTSALAAINAVETTGATLLLIRGLRWKGVGGLWRVVSRSPVLAFCLGFSIVLGVGVGLATTNLGTLSRYRAPLMPFFIFVLLVIGWKRSDLAPEY